MITVCYNFRLLSYNVYTCVDFGDEPADGVSNVEAITGQFIYKKALRVVRTDIDCLIYSLHISKEIENVLLYVHRETCLLKLMVSKAHPLTFFRQ